MRLRVMSVKNVVKQEVDQGARLASAVERIMRPFIRLLVGRVSCGFLVQQVKRIYIEEARASIKQNDPEARVTKSKLAMLTGLDTRTITNFEETAQPAEETRISDLCAEAAVLDAWNSDAKYRDENEQPKILPILGKGSSFQTLVGSTIGRNVTCQTVLEKLEESGNVEVVDQNLVRMVNPFYQPIKESEGILIEYGSMSTSSLLDTINHNLNFETKNSRRLQQNRWSMRVKKSDVKDLERELRELVELQILDVEKILIRYEQLEDRPNLTSFGVGWFLFGEKT
ncbi:MAG: DUF6502 family protein [Wenzhouxiangellaceae bacterium]